MSDAASTEIERAAALLPAWARISDKRRAHILRVTALLDQWARAMEVPAEEARAWRDVGLLHDALRDAPESELRALSGDAGAPAEILHGPAVARWLADGGETRADVLEAIRWHTLGHPRWARAGRALYMADFLEPGRKFSQDDRSFLAALVPHDFDGVFRQVVRMRLEYGLREGLGLFPETVELWNAIR
jgi:2-amino-4-hydroxy-6-hydroxymethyldihydropteridine diphosphokinase